MDKVLECVPNFSEGREQKIIKKIAACFMGAHGVKLLGYESDIDHNRSVFTLIGSPQGVAEAVINAAGVAVSEIDLRRHSGKHPRIGAVDVIPLIAVKDVSLAETREVADYVGCEIYRRWGLPVYMYERSARAEHRKNLADVRRGGFEGLAEKMRHPLWAPDYGGVAPHVSAGACAVGVRDYLIAYNINLASNDVALAKEIAAKIRFSGGGLKNCKALGLYLASIDTAQVSINLTDYNITGLFEVFEAVRALAEEQGVAIKNSELIGYVPQAAMAQAAARFLKMDNFTANKVLENNF